VAQKNAVDLHMMEPIYKELLAHLTNFQKYFGGMKPSQMLKYHDAYTQLRNQLHETLRANKVVQAILRGNTAAVTIQPQLAPQQHMVAGGLDSIDVSRKLTREVKSMLKANPLSKNLDVHSLNSLRNTIQPLLDKKLNKLTVNRSE
jgi:hypothetical protein